MTQSVHGGNKTLALFLLLLSATLLFGLLFAPAAQGVLQVPDCEDGPCDDCHREEPVGAHSSWTAYEGTYIWKVVIKKGNNYVAFEQDGSDECYSVDGIDEGGSTVTVDACENMSHVYFYYQCDPCTETERGEELSRGEPYWNDQLGQLCQQVTYQLWDKYDPTHDCGTETVEECQDYERCTETERGEELSRGEPYWNDQLGQLCQQVTYQLWDKYDSTYDCGTETVDECEGYELCTGTERGEELTRGEPYWNGQLGQLCQQVTYQLWDKYDSTHDCGTETVEECEGYELCTETERGEELSRGEPYWNDQLGQLCQQVTRQLWDKYDPTHDCGTETVEECQDYELCAETERGEEVSRGAPYWNDQLGQLCQQVSYARYDVGTGERCYPNDTVEECHDYERCTETVRGAEISRQGPNFVEGGPCWEVTYQLRDKYDPTYECGTEEATECLGVQLPTPAPGSCPTCLEDLLFQSDRHGNWEIYQADACDAIRLTRNQAADTAPACDPTGDYVVFQSYRDGNWEIYTMDANGNNQVNLSQHPASDTAPFWSCPWIYFQSNRDGNWEIYRMNPDGTGQTRLTDNPVPDAQPSASCAVGKVAFQSYRDGNWELCIMNLGGSGVQRLTRTIWDEVSPTWSPTGDRIAFQTNYGGKWQIAVMDLTSGGLSYITRDGGDAAQSPVWRSTCDWIYFQGLHYGDWDIYRVKPDGNLAQRVVYYPYAPDMLDDQVVSP